MAQRVPETLGKHGDVLDEPGLDHRLAMGWLSLASESLAEESSESGLSFCMPMSDAQPVKSVFRVSVRTKAK